MHSTKSLKREGHGESDHIFSPIDARIKRGTVLESRREGKSELAAGFSSISKIEGVAGERPEGLQLWQRRRV